jgi:hypothetical protein
MAILGSSDLWSDFFPDELIPDILAMVIRVWEEFIQPSAYEHEVHITRRFRSALEQYKDLKRLPLRIDREVPVDDLDNAVELGRVDLRLTHGFRSDVYFAFECKRLRVVSRKGRVSNLAGEYVLSGMMRFIGLDAQYARTMNKGGMIGYIMDGLSSEAMTAVNKQLKNYHEKLRMVGENSLSQSSQMEHPLIRETLHQFSDDLFTIHHVFLPSCKVPKL